MMISLKDMLPWLESRQDSLDTLVCCGMGQEDKLMECALIRLEPMTLRVAEHQRPNHPLHRHVGEGGFPP